MNGNKALPVGEGLLTSPLDPIEEVRLQGSKCGTCGEVLFGHYVTCAHCASSDVKDIPLSKKGTLWTYTIIYHQPPGQYRGATNPFVPFVEGLVELPDGVRVVSFVDIPLDQVKIGMELELVIYELYKNNEGQPVIAYKFKAA